jgi:hypothetical protein
MLLEILELIEDPRPALMTLCSQRTCGGKIVDPQNFVRIKNVHRGWNFIVFSSFFSYDLRMVAILNRGERA